MRVVITGGAGYVGALLTAELLEAGHSVTVYDSLIFGVEPLLHLLRAPRLSIVRADVRDRYGIERAMHGADIVYHLAALSGYPACEADPGGAWDINVEGTRNVVAALAPEQLLVYASSTSIYGPQTLYARTKLAAEEIVMERANSVAIRWATLFGVAPRMRHELLPNAFTRATVTRGHVQLFSPEQRRTFMHVADAANNYHRLAWGADPFIGHVWDVGDSGLTCSKRELVEQISHHVDCTYSVAEMPDADGRDIDVAFGAAHMLGLGAQSRWGEHIPELVRLYQAWPKEAVA